MGDIYNIGLLLRSKPTENIGSVWTGSPTCIGVFLYSVLTPSVCFCGLIGNFICLLVLCKNEFMCSFYVYLRVIAAVDFASCCIVFVSGLARGALWWKSGWAAYDAIISIPVGGFLGYMSTIATIFTTIDRLVYLKNPLRRYKPRFCRRATAAKITGCSAIISFACTTPYCFIYEFSKEGTLETTNFYDSRFYLVYNWFDLTFFGIIPLILLSVGNAALISTLKNARHIQTRSDLLKGKCRKLLDQSKTTVTLIAIVFVYLICEFPTHLTARKTAANILFGGDDEKANASTWLEVFRQVTTLLNAVHLASKFMLYCFFCPPFWKALKRAVTGRSDEERKKRRAGTKNMFVKVFVIDRAVFGSNLHISQGVDWSRLEFMKVLINRQTTRSLPSLL